MKENTDLKKETDEWQAIWLRPFRMNVCTILKKMERSHMDKHQIKKATKKMLVHYFCLRFPPTWS